MGQCDLAVGHLHLRMCFPTELTDRLDHLGHATPVGGMVVAEAAPVGVERQSSMRCLQCTVEYDQKALRAADGDPF